MLENLEYLEENKMQFPQKNNLSEAEITTAIYRNHLNISAITEKMGKLGNPTFCFDFILYEETVKEVNNLKSKNVSQKVDIPVKIVEESRYCFIIILITRCHVLIFPLI